MVLAARLVFPTDYVFLRHLFSSTTRLSPLHSSSFRPFGHSTHRRVAKVSCAASSRACARRSLRGLRQRAPAPRPRFACRDEGNEGKWSKGREGEGVGEYAEREMRRKGGDSRGKKGESSLSLTFSSGVLSHPASLLGLSRFPHLFPSLLHAPLSAQVEVSYLEIYNEKLRDLLLPRNAKNPVRAGYARVPFNLSVQNSFFFLFFCLRPAFPIVRSRPLLQHQSAGLILVRPCAF